MNGGHPAMNQVIENETLAARHPSIESRIGLRDFDLTK
jgi:hypothetical protein